MAIRAASKARTRRTKKPWSPEVTATPKKPAKPVYDGREGQKNFSSEQKISEHKISD